MKWLNLFSGANRKFFLTALSLILLSGFISFFETENDIDPSVLSSTTSETNNTVNTIQSDEKLYDVEKVVDGDTVKLAELGTVRLIGVDTPETVHPTKQVECFGKEASLKTSELLFNTKVWVEFDDSQGEKDKYGRYLVYLFKEDNTFVNLELIRQGYAHEYTYSSKYKYQNEFKQAQTYAKDNLLGLWGNFCVN